MQTFSNYTPGAKLIKNQFLPGLLMSYLGLFHAKAQHDLVINTSPRLHIIKDDRKILWQFKEKYKNSEI